jgi:nucleotide-binding universal stress UspA family protein
MLVEESAMFQKIVVAYDQSAEAARALEAAIQLAKPLGAELHTVTVMADLPGYAALAEVGGESAQMIEGDHQQIYRALKEKAQVRLSSHGLIAQSHLIEGREVEAILSFLRQQKADLLVLGLHQRNFHIARLWSTVYELAQEAPCSVLGVH